MYTYYTLIYIVHMLDICECKAVGKWSTIDVQVESVPYSSDLAPTRMHIQVIMGMKSSCLANSNRVRTVLGSPHMIFQEGNQTEYLPSILTS